MTVQRTIHKKKLTQILNNWNISFMALDVDPGREKQKSCELFWTSFAILVQFPHA